MELKEGMYVRTKYNGIGKIIDYINDPTHYFFKCYKLDRDYVNCEEYITETDVLKASCNIIDLIEEKDLVEIEFYSPRYEERVTRLFEVDCKHKNNITFGNAHCQLNIFNGEWGKHDQLLEPAIKTIATKEQFEQIQYRIGD